MGKPQYTELERYGRSSQSRNGHAVTNFLLHTQEGDGSAESLAAYLNDPNHGASYHYTLRDAIVCDVVDTDLASWSVGDANAFTINLCFAGSYASWSRAEWLTRRNDIRIAAWLAVQDANKYDFSREVIKPPYGVEREGISDHRYVTDVIGWGTHTDVGSGFPWDVFAQDVAEFVGTPTEEDTMPNAEDIAAAVWAHRLDKPDGKSNETAGNLLTWIDQHTGDDLDQMTGPDTKNQRGAIKPTGWPQLGQTEGKPHSVVDGLSSLMARVESVEAKLDTILAALEAKP